MSSSNITRVNDNNFVDEVLKSDRPVLIDFYADWCGPCKAFAPTLEKYAAQHPEIKVVKVNVDDSPQASQGIQSIPTLALVKDGMGVVIGTGNMPLSGVEAGVQKGLDFFAQQANSPKGPQNSAPKGPKI